MDDGSSQIPVIFVKSKNTPSDGYHEHFHASDRTLKYDPVFAPVIDVEYLEDAQSSIRNIMLDYKFHDKAFSEGDYRAGYGGLILTSQRAVEAFADAINVNGFRDSAKQTAFVSGGDFPIYTVGPATAKAIRDMELQGTAVLGEQSGKGENLAQFIRDHYTRRCEHKGWAQRPPLLFIVGETRKDKIPTILDDPSLPDDQRINVEMLIIYKTARRKNFGLEFSAIIERVMSRSSLQWVVLFSGQGCKPVLDALSRLDSEGNDVGRERSRAPHCYIASIGESTKDDLVTEYGCMPDAVSKAPTPQGVSTAIEQYMDKYRLTGRQ